MDKLIKLVEEWSINKGLNTSDPNKQFLKVAEEFGEIAAGLARNDLSAIEDGIGDTIVTLIILSQQLGLSLEGCLETAYDEIKGRTGKMINGLFIKSEDLNYDLIGEFIFKGNNDFFESKGLKNNSIIKIYKEGIHIFFILSNGENQYLTNSELDLFFVKI